ncbi:MAG TPA: hypothetical protein VNL77_21550 [Roseiflexaceae bacterium]|nr:hypothetical protein [Roseiflexaceae bacterium]
MKIALVAPPQPGDAAATPPLPLAYTAALLEQRHIVRIYDLAVRGSSPHGDPFASLRAFRPHVAVIATTDAALAAETGQRLATCSGAVLHLGLAMREWADVETVVRTLRTVSGCPSPGENEQNVIIDALLALDADLDALPAPARHLLSLEQYPAYTPAGDLRTPILVGRPAGGGYRMRSPALLISELRSVTHEHGVLHFVFGGAPVTHDARWLRELLRQLAAARLGIGWEGGAAYGQLTRDLLEECRQAGCEGLELTFDAMAVIDAKRERTALTQVVQQAHELGITVRARIGLESRFSSVPVLVDMAATFGLDDVRFSVLPQAHERGPEAQPAMEELAELVRARYQSSRSRQYFVERFGERLGPVLWRVGRTGLLGATFRRRAVGGEATSEVVAEG